MTTITPCLWFDGNGLEAAELYVSIIPDSRITDVSYYGPEQPGKEGAVMTVAFELAGRPYTALNGGPAVQVHRGDLAAGLRRRPGRGRPVHRAAHRRRRRGRPVRLGQGPLRPVLAGRSRGADQADRRPEPGARQRRRAGHARHDQDRHPGAARRRGRRGPVRLTRPRPTWTSSTRPGSPSSASATAASCRCTATACWATWSRQKTRCRRRCCGRGRAGPRSTAVPARGPGCTASSPRRASTSCARRSAARRAGRRVDRGRALAAAVPRRAARRGRASPRGRRSAARRWSSRTWP